MAQPLTDLVQQFCNFQRKQRGKTEGGVKTYRWNLVQFLVFIRNRDGRLARVTDLTASTVQAWMDDMAAEDLALSTMRVRQSTVSSFCAWLVKREVLTANPVAKLERPPHHREPPRQVPGSSIMDALVEAAKERAGRVTWRSSRSCVTPACGANRWRPCAYITSTARRACEAFA
jgi:integrase/recombinase XerC